MLKVMEGVDLNNHTLKNRVIRAATFEGMADTSGVPQVKSYCKMYGELIDHGLTTIVTGFNYTSKDGKAMQPGQASIETKEQVDAWKQIVDFVHEKGATILMQISHTGRQTLKSVTGFDVKAPSSTKCTYFKQKAKALSLDEISRIVDDYINTAKNCQTAGFDGVQVHGAHGYLIHQFLNPFTNKRRDQYGPGPERGYLFYTEILTGIRKACGEKFILATKLDVADDRGWTSDDAKRVCQHLDAHQLVDFIEFSYGSMEFALNIFRGKTIPIKPVFEHNVLFSKYPKWVQSVWLRFVYPHYKKRFIPFSPLYNFENGKKILQGMKTPIFLTGGIRKSQEIDQVLDAGFSGVTLSRPFLSDIKTMKQIESGEWNSNCINCNLCAVMCDSKEETQCFVF